MATMLAKRFAWEYTRDFRAEKSAIRAGASPRSARTTASRWLKDAEVQGWIEEFLRQRREKNEVLVQRTIAEFARIAFGSIGDVAEVVEGQVRIRDFNEMEPEHVAAVKELKVGSEGEKQVKMHAKVQALNSLAKILGLYEDDTDDAKKVELIHRFVSGQAEAKKDRGAE